MFNRANFKRNMLGVVLGTGLALGSILGVGAATFQVSSYSYNGSGSTCTGNSIQVVKTTTVNGVTTGTVECLPFP